MNQEQENSRKSRNNSSTRNKNSSKGKKNSSKAENNNKTGKIAARARKKEEQENSANFQKFSKAQTLISSVTRKWAARTGSRRLTGCAAHRVTAIRRQAALGM